MLPGEDQILRLLSVLYSGLACDISRSEVGQIDPESTITEPFSNSFYVFLAIPLMHHKPNEINDITNYMNFESCRTQWILDTLSKC